MQLALPYHDTKPTGAADFYFAINATFRFIRRVLGESALVKYWTDLGTHYMAPVAAAWREGGLPSVAKYWEAFFQAEPGADVEVTLLSDSVVLEVRRCPAIAHLRSANRVIDPAFCRHCYYVGEATAKAAGMTARVKGGNGCCRQSFHLAEARLPAQNLEDIAIVP
jgi:hypothetical protein